MFARPSKPATDFWAKMPVSTWGGETFQYGKESIDKVERTFPTMPPMA
jgi:hypothetical protein